MILADANLLIYAADSDSPHHHRARRWLESMLSGTTRVGLARVVILAFVRVTTRAGVLRRPLAPEAALAYIDSWLRQPYVEAIGPGSGQWPVLRALLRTTGMAGNLTSDAHLAAIAIERGCTVYSSDNDFKRFTALEHVNPLSL